METFPFNLAAARRNAYMSQQELADKSRISLRQIQDIERGKVVKCRPFTVRQLAEVLGVDLSAVPRHPVEDGAPVADRHMEALDPVQQSMFDSARAEPDDVAPPDGVRAGSSGLHARRIRTLLLTHVLNHLETTKVFHEGWAPYDMHALQLQAIQAVVEHMGLLSGGATRLALSANLVDFARWMAPDQDAAMHQEVAEGVIDWLLNDKERDVFAPSYVDFDGDGMPVRRQTAIELLRERQEPDGTLVIRASVEAINLLLGALSDDVADAQWAEERLLANLIEKGQYDAAVDQARRAQLRSIQYSEQVGRWLATARQDLSQLDWAGVIKMDHDKALHHVSERESAEAEMRDRVTELLRTAADLGQVDALRRVVVLLKDCHSRHTQLRGLLMKTGGTFRYEQERQRFVRPLGLSPIILRHALGTALEAPVRESAPADTFFRALIGPIPRRLLDVVRLAAELNAPGREGAPEAPEIPDLVLVESSPAVRFPEEVWRASDEVLDAVTHVPRRLSALLEESRRSAPAHPELAAELTRLRALEAFAPEGWGASTAGLLASEKDGLALQDRAYQGDDLLVRRGGNGKPAIARHIEEESGTR